MLIYDSTKRTKVPFEPIEDGKVRMYICGPTVYDNIHIGNARTFLSFDVIRRWFLHAGYDVTFSQNITDVDDKIINRANETRSTSAAVAEQFTQAFIDVMRRFNILDPDIRPHATQEIDTMIAMIEELIAKGHAYASENGDVYFSVRSDEQYGHLSGRDIDDLISGARVEKNEAKRDPLDFALWKAAKPGEPSWRSPWGEGRPGWHTECAAMVHKHLGTPIDIHGGGSDLTFPHHENEAAQAECAWNAPLANVWMHTGMLLVDGEKMSKSLGNFFTLDEVLAEHSPEALRLLMLQTHYRSPLDFSYERLTGAAGSLERIRTCVRNLRWAAQADQAPQAHGATSQADDANTALREAVIACNESVEREMADDFNTASALAAVFNLVTEANTFLAAAPEGDEARSVALDAAATLEGWLAVFGIDPEKANEDEGLPAELVDLAIQYAGYAGEDVEEAAQELLNARAQAREQKDWATADAIRDNLSSLGFIIEDTAQGSRVVRAHG